MTSQAVMQSGRVTTEGDELYYEVRGKGPPLLLIPGGGVDGGSYSRIADILSASRGKNRERYLNRAVTTAFFIKQELLPVTNYLPDLKPIGKNSVKVVMAAGQRSLDKRGSMPRRLECCRRGSAARW
jgi:hypothetical protein